MIEPERKGLWTVREDDEFRIDQNSDNDDEPEGWGSNKGDGNGNGRRKKQRAMNWGMASDGFGLGLGVEMGKPSIKLSIVTNTNGGGEDTDSDSDSRSSLASDFSNLFYRPESLENISNKTRDSLMALPLTPVSGGSTSSPWLESKFCHSPMDLVVEGGEERGSSVVSFGIGQAFEIRSS